MSKASYRNLIVWQKADQLAKIVFLEVQNFPKEERYVVTSQLKRAVLSVPTNIVEGCARKGSKELKHFLSIALGSLAETEYLLDFSLSMRYLSRESFDKLHSLRQEVGNLLWKFFLSC